MGALMLMRRQGLLLHPPPAPHPPPPPLLPLLPPPLPPLLLLLLLLLHMTPPPSLRSTWALSTWRPATALRSCTPLPLPWLCASKAMALGHWRREFRGGCSSLRTVAQLQLQLQGQGQGCLRCCPQLLQQLLQLLPQPAAA